MAEYKTEIEEIDANSPARTVPTKRDEPAEEAYDPTDEIHKLWIDIGGEG